jgi:hypothetical protein
LTTVPKDEFRPLPHLAALGAVGAAIVGVFFGVGFWLLSPRHPTAPSADPGLHAQTLQAYEAAPDPGAPAEALEVHEVPPDPTLQPQALEAYQVTPPPNETAAGTSSPPHAERANREASALESTAMETKLIPPAGVTHAKRRRVVRYHRQIKTRQWDALWRPDSHAGPNPGGGFYGPPNINVGYIDPR